MVKQIDKNEARLRRHRRVRNKISGTAARPRLDVFRSAKHIYAQIIDDEQGVTLVSASTMDKDFNGFGGNVEAAAEIGKKIAAKALEKGITDLFLALAGLAFFVLDDLALVADALALVRLRRLLGADLGGVLADLLLVNTGNSEVVGILPNDGAILGIGDVHLMREAQIHHEVGALLLAAQTNTDDLQLLLIAVDDTVHHVGDVGAGQAMQAACFGLVIGAGNQNLIALDLDGHEGMIVGIQAALGALDGDGVCCLIDSDSDAGRNDDGFSSNSRHCLLPLSYHT